MNEEQFKQLIGFGKETVSLEFKESQTWDVLKPKIMKCILAMSNTQNGGNLVIGIHDNGDILGVDPAHLATYNEEHIKDAISPYAHPYVDFDMDIVSTSEGPNFVVFTIREFNELPVICPGHGNGLERGAIYVRTRNRRPESVKIPDAIHMRELIDLAVDKSKVRLHQRAGNALQLNAQQQFQKQIDDAGII